MRIWRKVAGLSFFDQLVLNFVVKAKKSNRRMDPSLDDSPVIFVYFEGRPGIEISLDQISPGAIARAFSVSCNNIRVPFCMSLHSPDYLVILATDR